MHAPFRIETQRLLLRPWEPADEPGFREMVGDPEMMRYISSGRPWDEERIAEFQGRQRRNLATHGCCMGALVERESGLLCGVCGLQPMRAGGEIEVGWWVAKRRWGRGFATEAGAAALRFAWERLDLHRVLAIAEPANLASRRVMEKLGMRFERQAAGRDFGLPAADIALVVYAIERPPGERLPG